MKIDNATKVTARDLAYLINLAGDGIPNFLWSKMKQENQSEIDVGISRAKREDGGFSYKNARICSMAGSVLGMAISYKPTESMNLDELSDIPEVIRPLLQLEARLPQSWYVNAIAVFEQYRNKGIARMLMADAEMLAVLQGIEFISLIVGSDNLAARKLYMDIGYTQEYSLPKSSSTGCEHYGEWILMKKKLLEKDFIYDYQQAS